MKNQTKRCPECKRSKSISEFHKYKNGKDGFQSYCKVCEKITQQKYRKSAKGKIVQKRYAQSEKGKIVCRKAVHRHRQTEKGRIAHCQESLRYQIRHPERRKAISAVYCAIKSGKMLRPNTFQCRCCPSQAEQYHHYLGYEPECWLFVMPLCRKCHLKIHKKIAS